MDVSAEAADLVVKEGIQVTESAVKLAGTGLKNVAALLLALAKEDYKVVGKTNAKRLARENSPPVVIPLKKEDMAQFGRLAKEYGVLYFFAQKKGNESGYVNLVSTQAHAAQLNAIMEALHYFYAYNVFGVLDGSGYDYIAELGYDDLPEVYDLTAMGWDGAPMDVDDEGTAFLTLGPEAEDVLAGIGFSLYYVDEENDMMLLLGTDNDMEADWENGIFYDNFRGVWGAIDGHIVYMELSFEGEDYNLYSIPPY